MNGGLLIAGTGSDAGKSVLVAGICRWLARQGVTVAPFKAQNMSLNSAVTGDGAEIGRAQAMQAMAAGVPAEAAMNPVLLKPGGDGRSQVVLRGKPVAYVGARDYAQLKPRLFEQILDCYADLRARYDVVVCEGAGSPAEINLREHDVANLGLARQLDLPAVVVGDIDRGGVFAAMVGTLAVLAPQDQDLIAGFVINKFRGDLSVLSPGIDMLTRLTGRPTLGVIPWKAGLWLDVEDSLDLDSRPLAGSPPLGPDSLRVAVIAVPCLSNITDMDALRSEPGVLVRLASSAEQIADADLVVLPGTRATVADLAWLRESGLAEAIVARARAGGHTLGICGGYQMLAAAIEDNVESGAGRVDGLGLLPATVRFATGKTVGRPHGSALGEPVHGYEIHHGVATVCSGEPFLDGCRLGSVWGTSWHGVFDNDGFRRAFLQAVATDARRRFVVAPQVSFADVRQRRLDVLADLVAEHLDTGALSRLISDGPPRQLPRLSLALS